MGKSLWVPLAKKWWVNHMQKIISSDLKQIFQKWNLPDMDLNKKKQAEPEPNEDLTARIEEAYQKGLLDGRQREIDEIRRELTEEYEKNYTEKINELERYIHQFHHPWVLANQEVESYLLQLTVAIVKKLLRSELTTKPDYIMNIIHECIELLPESCKKLQLFLNTIDFERIKKYLPEMKTTNLDIEFQVDENLSEGECRVASDDSFINATWENKINVIIDQVFKNVS